MTPKLSTVVVSWNNRDFLGRCLGSLPAGTEIIVVDNASTDGSAEMIEAEKLPGTDAAILWYGIDRTRRTTTGEARVPKGKWSDISGSLGEFRKLRATMREYARTT